MTISARVVAHSISPEGKEIASVGVTAHRFILAEINTHRVLSRSYRSSRAVPSARLIEEVRTNPASPRHWGVNRPGMQASEELQGVPLERAQELWRAAAREAANHAEAMAQCGLHKQVANRVFEPFLWVHGIVTATEWDNFFGLRLHATAQPEFRALADAMWVAIKASEPALLEPGLWHTPYVDLTDEHDYEQIAKACRRDPRDGTYDLDDSVAAALKMSTARCARSSYNSFDTGKRSTLEEDLATYAKLNIPGTENYDPAHPIHASPAEHQATPDDIESKMTRHEPDVYRHPAQQGNFVGWRQYRKTLPGESKAPMPEGYL